MDQNELYHHGVKGMKWGVRRFQKKDGSLTSAGKKRYSEDGSGTKKKSEHQAMLEKRYQKAGLTQREAEIAAAKRVRTEKIVLGAAGLTMAAAATYVASKHFKNQADAIIKSGNSLQRVTPNGSGNLHDVFYAANTKGDKARYAGILGMTRKMQAGKSYAVDIGLNTDVKVAGNKTAKATFKKLYKNDADFRNAAESIAKVNAHGKNKAYGNMKKMYDNFNSNFVLDRDNPAVKKFYDELKSQGYDAVRDINDMKFSGYKATNPLIVFNKSVSSGDISVKSVKELTNSEIMKNYVEAGARNTAQDLAKYGGVALAAGGLLMIDEDKNAKVDKDEIKRKYLKE